MLYIRIPTKTDGTNKPHTVQRVTLEGTDYYVRLDWNMRSGWYLGLSDQDEVPIFSPKKIVANWDMLGSCSDDRRPRGALYCLDTKAQVTSKQPSFEELGSRHKLVYFLESEVEELGL